MRNPHQRRTSTRSLMLLTMAFPLTAALAADSPAEARPNVILINVDNHEKGELGYYGNRFIETPNVDRLFHEGVRFENYHISGRCTSSRSALMTGRYHARNGALGTGAAWESTREGLTTLAHVFSRGGYRTAMFGKWHMGDTRPLRPEDRGFEEVVTIHNGSTLGKVVVKPGYNDSPRTAAAYRFRHNGQWKVYEGFRTDIWFRELVRYLQKTRENDRPFFVYLATVTAHGPHYGPADLREKYRRKIQLPRWSDLGKRSASRSGGKTGPVDHAADIGGLDRNIGRLMETLDKLKLSDNTVIVYMSDGAGGGAASVPKSQWPEASRALGTPMVIRWPKAAAKRMPERSELVANIDLLPTLAGICGIPLGAKLQADIDGQSFASLLGLPGAGPWRPRTYVADHQSRGGKDDLGPENRRMMLFRPLAATRVFLPDGGQVGWRAGEVSDRNVPPEVVKQARAAYEKWRLHVLKDFPLGAFALVDGPNAPVYLDAYPIPDGPAGAGTKGYFLLDVAKDGSYRISSDTSDRYGGRAGPAETSIPATLWLSRKSKPGPLPVGFDEKLNGYRVLPATLREYFETTTHKVTLPTTIPLRDGRYLLSLESRSGKGLVQLRVSGTGPGVIPRRRTAADAPHARAGSRPGIRRITVRFRHVPVFSTGGDVGRIACLESLAAVRRSAWCLRKNMTSRSFS